MTVGYHTTTALKHPCNSVPIRVYAT